MPNPSPKIPLLKGWPVSVKSGVLHVMALAQFAMTYARGWAADSVNTRVRLKAELDQANIVLCTGGVEQLSLKLFVVRFVKDLLGFATMVSTKARCPSECRHP